MSKQNDILYICDRKQCGDKCNPSCRHTTDLNHAAHFSFVNADSNYDGFWEETTFLDRMKDHAEDKKFIKSEKVKARAEGEH